MNYNLADHCESLRLTLSVGCRDYNFCHEVESFPSLSHPIGAFQTCETVGERRAELCESRELNKKQFTLGLVPVARDTL